MITIEWGTHLKPMNNSREHHYARAERVKKQREATRLMLISHQASQLVAARKTSADRLLVTFVRIAPRKVDPGDNLNSCFKSIRDEIAAYFGVNDGDENSIRFDYAPQLKGPSSARIIIALEPHTPVRTARVTTTALSSGPKEWARKGMLSSGIVRNR